MKVLLPHDPPTLSSRGKNRLLGVRGEPFLLADWERTLMLHFEIDPEVLQPFVPFTLDTWKGKAYVSLVAFTMRGMHPRLGGGISAWLMKPIATHEFLNIRTYVRHKGEQGIHFITEWLPNRLSVALGRPLFGLPYELAHFDYQHDHEIAFLKGHVQAVGPSTGTLKYEGTIDEDNFVPAPSGTLTEFLMERYTAFTCWGRLKRLFRVWHEPWQQCEADITVGENTLAELSGDWAKKARYIGANYSPGARNVWMSRPLFC